MYPTDVIFTNLGLPDEEHAKECIHCAQIRDAIIRARSEVERMHDASPISKYTAAQLSCEFVVKIAVNPNDMDMIDVSIKGISEATDAGVEIPDAGREFTIEQRATKIVDAFLTMWSTLFTTNEANERISQMYEEFDAIREGEHAPAPSHLN